MTGWRKRQVMEMALKFVEDLECGTAALEAAIKEALAQPEQEPVAWMDVDGNVSDNNDHNCFPVPLYTSPPQRTWVRLTEEDLKLLSAEWRIVYGAWLDDFARDIEAKLMSKNT